MSEELMPGDRVRITPRCRRGDYKAGDKGTVLEGPADRAGAGEKSYPGLCIAVVGEDVGGSAKA
jgi:hypothetical protein